MGDCISGFRGEYRWLSNFWFSNVSFEGHTYRTVEHAYVASKTLCLEDRLYIKSLSKPSEAKRFGKSLELRGDWEDVKLVLMEDFTRQKFSSGVIREKLLGTGDSVIVEENWWGDTFWGVCKGSGENHLGKIIMKVRSEIKGQNT